MHLTTSANTSTSSPLTLRDEVSFYNLDQYPVFCQWCTLHLFLAETFYGLVGQAKALSFNGVVSTESNQNCLVGGIYAVQTLKLNINMKRYIQHAVSYFRFLLYFGSTSVPAPRVRFSYIGHIDFLVSRPCFSTIF